MYMYIYGKLAIQYFHINKLKDS